MRKRSISESMPGKDLSLKTVEGIVLQGEGPQGNSLCFPREKRRGRRKKLVILTRHDTTAGISAARSLKKVWGQHCDEHRLDYVFLRDHKRK